jgi:hypothetical protein
MQKPEVTASNELHCQRALWSSWHYIASQRNKLGIQPATSLPIGIHRCHLGACSKDRNLGSLGECLSTLRCMVHSDKDASLRPQKA